MSDSLEPPAKRARLEADAPIYGASAPALDAPGSPVDDLDDDFYDNSPVKPSALPAVEGTASMFAAAAPAPVGFHLPGLGSTSEAHATHAALPVAAEAHEDEAPEDGELSDDEAFYNDASAVAPPAANQEQVLGDAPQHDAAAASPTVDTDGELDAALTAAIEHQNQQDRAEIEAAAAQASDAAIIDSKLEFLRAAEANRDNKDAEWQLDSDASDSDSSSDSSSSDSDQEGGSDDGELLDPEEQVRLLLEEALEEEPGPSGKAKVKTQNEVDEQYEKPDITMTDDTKVTELGNVESVVENLVLIKGNTSGDYQVLESGSALCLQNRTVIGKVSEQIGRVEEPRYALGFNDAAEITALGIQKDTPIYYVNEHSTFVLTEPLRYQKHTDASNLHDEETNEVEFSDDEKEAEYKREQKARKRARTEGSDEPAPTPTVSMPIPTGPRAQVEAPMAYRSMEYQGGGLKYSDDEDEDLGMYKPLARPDHFEQIVGQGAPLEDRSHVRRGMGRGRGPWGDRGRSFRVRGGFTGRGDFNAGQGNRGGFGGGRGDFGAGRGDRGGHGNRGDRGGNNNRGDRGGRGPKGQADRGGRQQDQFQNRQPNQQKNGSQHDGRSATSASPARQQQDRQGSQSQQGREQSQAQPSPATGGKNKNRKQRQREKRERERLQQQQQQQGQQPVQPQGQQHQQAQKQQQHSSPAPSGPSNTNAYANNSNTGWPAPYSAPPQPVANFGQVPVPPPQAAVTSYPYAAFAAQAQPQPQPQPQAQAGGQANMAAWAQWLQLAAAMTQQQSSQPSVQAAAPPPPRPVPQHQAGMQYSYPYQQYGQPAPPANPQQQGNGQASTQSLQDILRALGGGGAPQ